MKSLLLIAVCVLVVKASGYNFPFESDQLVPADTEAFPAIAFGNAADAHPIQDLHGCRAFPGSPSWPPPEEWRELNGSLGGALLNPMPPGAVCYSNSEYYNQNACNDILANARSSRFYIDDPVSEMTTWTEGRTCSARNNPPGNCTQGGFPVYVVSYVRHSLTSNWKKGKSIAIVFERNAEQYISSTGQCHNRETRADSGELC